MLNLRWNGQSFRRRQIQTYFLQWKNVRSSIKISLKFVPKSPINNIPTFVQIMAWCRPGDKPLSEPVIVCRCIYIYIWVRSRRWACLVTWFCNHLIAKPGNKTGEPSWPDPYVMCVHYLPQQKSVQEFIYYPSISIINFDRDIPAAVMFVNCWYRPQGSRPLDCKEHFPMDPYWWDPHPHKWPSTSTHWGQIQHGPHLADNIFSNWLALKTALMEHH